MSPITLIQLNPKAAQRFKSRQSYDPLLINDSFFHVEFYAKFQYLEKGVCHLIIEIGLLHKTPRSSVVKILTLHRVRYEYHLTITSHSLHILGFQTIYLDT